MKRVLLEEFKKILDGELEKLKNADVVDLEDIFTAGIIAGVKIGEIEWKHKADKLEVENKKILELLERVYRSELRRLGIE